MEGAELIGIQLRNSLLSKTFKDINTVQITHSRSQVSEN